MSSWDRKMYWAAFCTAFFGFLGVSEYTSPSVTTFNSFQTMLRSDVQLLNSAFRLRIKVSNTDPFCQVVDLFLHSSHRAICPAKALKKYLSVGRSPQELSLFIHEDSSYLTTSQMTLVLCSLLHRLGFNKKKAISLATASA